MIKRIAVFASLAVGFTAPASSQDLNTLNRHLENQQWQRVQDHQNQSRTSGPRKNQQGKPLKRLEACNQNHVPRDQFRRMELEYGKKVRAEGKASANRWSQQQSTLWYQRLKQDGVCK